MRQVELAATIAANLSAQYPETNRDVGVRVVPALEEVAGDVARGLLLLSAAVGALLAVGCVNVASLSFARTIAREKDLATRVALGGTRARIARQLVLESLLLAALGGLFGTLLAFSAVGTVGTLLAGSMPRADEIVVDAYVLGIGVGLSLGAGLIFGLAPAFAASRLALSGALKAGAHIASQGARTARVFAALIGAEMALATVLLAGAGIFVQSFLKLDRLDTAFDPANVLTFELSWPASKYRDPADAFGRLRGRLLDTPGILAASTDVQLPYRGEALLDDTAPFAQIEGRPLPAGERPRVRSLRVHPGFLRALGIPLVGGRDFGDADRAGSPRVAIVNRSFARAYLGSEEAIGNRLRLDSWTLAGDGAAEIVGVAEDVPHNGLRADVEPLVYVPFAQRPVWSATMIVKTQGDPLAYVPAVREAVRAIDSDQPIDNIGTLEQRLAGSLAADRLRALLLGSFSAMAVMIAGVGLFAVLVVHDGAPHARDRNSDGARGTRRGHRKSRGGSGHAAGRRRNADRRNGCRRAVQARRQPAIRSRTDRCLCVGPCDRCPVGGSSGGVRRSGTPRRARGRSVDIEERVGAERRAASAGGTVRVVAAGVVLDLDGRVGDAELGASKRLISRTATAESVFAAMLACSVTIGRSWLIDQACTWCTSSTNGSFERRCSRSARESMSGGEPSSRMWPLSAMTRHAERTMISATTIDSSGSIGIQPVARITSAAMTAATEPSRSPMTCSTAARMLRLSLVARAQHEEGEDVDGQARGRDPQHRRAEHCDGRVQPLHGLRDDPCRDRDQRDAVDERHEHGEPVEAVGAAPVGRLPREPEADPSEREAREVRQHVAGVGEQGQRAGEDAPDDLGDHESARQQRGEPDAALVGRVAVTVSMTMPGMVMIVIVVMAVIVCVSVRMLHKSIRSRAHGSTRELTHPPSARIMTAGLRQQRASDPRAPTRETRT